ncbi:MAG: efflux transporter outer membrane subunit [Chlamydiae bacterium]|nr:efflux transporter outer membrane subunit [Chlamydiota bacterium]
MTSSKACYASIALLLLSSCLSMSKQELTQNVLELPSVDKTVEDGLTSGYFTQGQWPEKEWWKVYKDEKLDHLIQTALTNNPSIQSIFRRVEEAKQDAKVVRSKLFPLVFFNYEETWQYLSKNGLYRALNPTVPLGANLIDLSVSFNYEFDFWSKNLNGFRAALGREKSQEAEAAQVELITTTAVAQAFFALKTNIKKRNLQQQLVDATAAIYKLQTFMKNQALYSLLTPLTGHEDLQESQKILIDIDDEIKFDKHLLNILVGQGPDTELNIGDEISAIPEKLTLPQTLSIDLLARRPDLMAQIWKVEALSKDVAIAKADFYPSVNLMGFAGLESTMFAKLLHRSSKTGALEPAIHLPIFTAGAIRANVRSKKAAFDQAVFDYNELILKSTQEVADLIVLTQSIWEKKNIQNKIVSEAKHLYDLVELRFEEGLDNLFNVLASQISLLQKELEEITLIYNQYLSSIKLIKSLGGGYISSYLPIKNDEVKNDGK